jgi:RNA polymerase sigma factor (sigma-70 family)
VATRNNRAVLQQLDLLFHVGTVGTLTDGQLLERFATGSGEAAERAFAALLARHGPMVLRVCRAQLSGAQDVQDAFQATFLVLLKKARALWVRDSLGPWLHQVAYRTASSARLAATRRRQHEQRAAEIAAHRGQSHSGIDSDASCEQLLHEEINRLPDRYRVPIILCDLEGLTCEEAARRMGRPVGTVKSWRSRGRARLRARLIRSGLAPATGLGTCAWLAAHITQAADREPAIDQWIQPLAAGATTGEVSTAVRILVKGVLKTMFFGKLRTTAGIACALMVLTAALGGAVRVAAGDPREAHPAPGNEASADQNPTQSTTPGQPSQVIHDLFKTTTAVETPWPLTIREAIRIGLDNAEAIRLISLSAEGVPDEGFVIAPINPDVQPEPFRVQVMATVRAIEQQYWSLAQQHVQLWSRTKAVALGEETFKRELADLEVGRGTAADVAESQQRLEQFRLDLVSKMSDVATTERQLRLLLGLPLNDGRRIVPATTPLEAKVSPDWDACVATMLEKHPRIVSAKACVRQAEAACAAANLDEVTKGFLPTLGRHEEPAPPADTARDRLAELEKEKNRLEQVIHDTTHSLARFFLEIDANYKQFHTASKLRTAAEQRLKAQQTLYDKGRITIDRYLDAVNQFASAVAQEAQFKATYNIALMALEEAKGTLLEHDQIVVAHRPVAGSPATATRDLATKPASHERPSPRPNSGPPAPAPCPEPKLPPSAVAVSPGVSAPAEPAVPADDGGKTYTFQFTIGIGQNPVQIRGSITVTPVRGARETR